MTSDARLLPTMRPVCYACGGRACRFAAALLVGDFCGIGNDRIYAWSYLHPKRLRAWIGAQRKPFIPNNRLPLMADLAEPGILRAESKLALNRTRLAYERTMLSWVRTAIALISFGFSIHEFFHVARAGEPRRQDVIGPHELGMTMIVIGLLALLLAALEHRSAIAALRMQYPVTEGYPEIPRSRATLLAALIAFLGLLALFATILRV